MDELPRMPSREELEEVKAQLDSAHVQVGVPLAVCVLLLCFEHLFPQGVHPVSALLGTGLDELQQSILSTVEKVDLVASVDRDAQGTPYQFSCSSPSL